MPNLDSPIREISKLERMIAMTQQMYVTKADGERMNFDPEFLQSFEHESSQPKTMPEPTLVKSFLKLPEYDKMVTLEVIKFLHQFTFASRDQLARLLDYKGIDPVGLNDNLDRMLEEREINSFFMNRMGQTDEMPEDAFIVYCMDFGGLAILKHFTNNDWLTWFTTDSVRRSGLVQKYLSTVEFYLALLKAKGPALRAFKATTDFSFGHRDIRVSATFEVMKGYSGHPFILESVRSFDLPMDWRDKIDNKLVHFACVPKHWGKYYSKEPVYIFLCENERDALEAADLFYRRTDGKENFRLITDDQVRLGLDKAKFLKYIPAPDPVEGEPPKMGALQGVVSSLLAGTAD